jgi:adenosylcobinamide-phosphate synthase
VWAEAALLSTTLRMDRLRTRATHMGAALAQDDMGRARMLGGEILDRDTSEWEAQHLAGETVAAVAEDTSRDVIAPLFYYVVGGIPGALIYRFILGIQDGMGEYRDKVMYWINYVPARITGALFVAASHVVGENGPRSWRIWRRDAVEAHADNRMHPRSAMAGALGVELGEEEDGQVVGSGERRADRSDVARAIRLMRAASAIGAGLLLGLPLLSRWRH